METQLMSVVWSLLAVLAGGLIGASFGMIQTRASKRNRQLEESGKLNSGFSVMPGSTRRVAYLVVALALVQLICPLLFTNHFEWWVSAGVVGGYGAILFTQLRRRLAQAH